MDNTFVPPSRSVAQHLGTASEPFGVSAPDVKNVLIIDDDPNFRNLMKVMLAQTGAQLAGVWEAEDSRTAIAICRKCPVELVFCDLNLSLFQSRNGLEVVRELRQIRPNVPIYMVTADNSEALIGNVLAAGATGHLLKPINLRILKRVLASS